MKLRPAIDKAVSTIRANLKQSVAVALTLAGVVLVPVGVAMNLGLGWALIVAGILAGVAGLTLDRQVE